LKLARKIAEASDKMDLAQGKKNKHPKRARNFSEGLGQHLTPLKKNVLHSQHTKCIDMNATHITIYLIRKKTKDLLY
jgi:hypothetical protein